MPIIGKTAPALEGTTTNGTFSLSDHKGKQIVVYFYPKDMTPGCTTEARDFRDAMDDFEAANTVVVGVSKDSVARHEKFQNKECLPFPLISDESGELCEAWGVWQEKKNYGKTYMGIVRSTFLIDGDGTVSHIWNKVRVKGHVAAVLEEAQQKVKK
ncbi:MAG: thioredoxin-dependent thiol peroxidase [Proteobacteria bacterium]|nr:thioredoxin-dependent thiol peroxidase [Pseudomonadota bacterium]